MICCKNINDNSDRENIEELLELLIFSGVNPSLKSSRGMIAYDYVERKDLLYERLIQLLQGTIRRNKTKSAATKN